MESADTPASDGSEGHNLDTEGVAIPGLGPAEEGDAQASSRSQISQASISKQPAEQGSDVYSAEIQQLMEAKKRELLQKLDSQQQEMVTHDAEQGASQALLESDTQWQCGVKASTIPTKPSQILPAPLATTQTAVHCDSDSAAKRTHHEGPSDSEWDSKRLRTSKEREDVKQDMYMDGRIFSRVADNSETVDDSSGCWKDIALASAADSEFTGAWTEFSASPDNFLKGCKWSPDGSCLVTNSNDNCLRVFQLPPEVWPSGEKLYKKLPELKSAVQIQEAELIYDYAWYTQMSLSDPDLCCLASSSRDTPIHMWDSKTGNLRCSYRAYDHMDELTAAYSLAFSSNGMKLYSGFTKMIRVFDVSRPGKDCQQRPTFVKHGQTGIISCIAMNPADPAMYAAGSYAKSVALYTEPKGEMYCMFEGQVGGVTQLAFSKDGNRLYSGGRKDREILCWDIRNPGRILGIMNRKVSTNQRIYFDLTDRFLWSAATDGTISAWDVTAMDESAGEVDEDDDPMLLPHLSFAASRDAINGLGCHPQLPILAAATGQRHFPLPSGLEGSSDSEADEVTSRENCLKLYWKTT